MMVSGVCRGQHSPPAGTVTSVMTPLLEKTDHMLASWGLSRGNTMQAKPKEGALSPQSEAAAKGEDPAEASNSVTSAVTPILEKTDEYLASWGLGTGPGSPKTEHEPAANAETVVQVSYILRRTRHGHAMYVWLARTCLCILVKAYFKGIACCRLLNMLESMFTYLSQDRTIA